MAILTLRIVRLENACDMLMPKLDQILCDHITTLTVIDQHLRLVLHLLKASLNEHIGNVIFIQFIIQVRVLTEDLTFTWFNNYTINVLLEQFLQAFCLHRTRISRVFQDNAIPLCRQNGINACDNTRKDIIRQVGGDNRNILRCMRMPYKFRTERTPTVFRIDIAHILQDLQGLTNCLSADCILLGQLILGGQLVPRLNLSG